MSARDERWNPQRGDIFKKPGFWNRRILFVGGDGNVQFLREGDPWGGVQSCWILEWREWAKNAEVIHPKPEAAAVEDAQEPKP